MKMIRFIELEPHVIPVLGQLHILSSIHTTAAFLMFNIQVGFWAQGSVQTSDGHEYAISSVPKKERLAAASSLELHFGLI